MHIEVSPGGKKEGENEEVARVDNFLFLLRCEEKNGMTRGMPTGGNHLHPGGNVLGFFYIAQVRGVGEEGEVEGPVVKKGGLVWMGLLQSFEFGTGDDVDGVAEGKFVGLEEVADMVKMQVGEKHIADFIRFHPIVGKAEVNGEMNFLPGEILIFAGREQPDARVQKEDSFRAQDEKGMKPYLPFPILQFALI